MRRTRKKIKKIEKKRRTIMRGGFVMTALGAMALNRLHANIEDKAMNYAKRFIESHKS